MATGYSTLPNVIEQLAREQSFHLIGTTMFYYEVHEQEFDDAKKTMVSVRERRILHHQCPLSKPEYTCRI